VEHKPRYAEMCARMLQQCEAIVGGRDALAAYLGAQPEALAQWLQARTGPPRAAFERAVDLILQEHDRRIRAQEAAPKRRRGER
jgi:DNA-binding transcriptional regulator YdaS (Cro superfamily)